MRDEDCVLIDTFDGGVTEITRCPIASSLRGLIGGAVFWCDC
jgi:hypothetical protein